MRTGGLLRRLTPVKEELAPVTPSIGAGVIFPMLKSSVAIESTAMVICINEIVSYDVQAMEPRLDVDVTEYMGFFIQGEPGCVFTAASNISGVKEANPDKFFNRSYRTRELYVISSANYDKLIKEVRTSRTPGVYHDEVLTRCGAKRVSEVQVEPPTSIQLFEPAEFEFFANSPAEDGVAILHFEGELEGAGPGFQVAEGAVISYPGSQGFALGAMYAGRSFEVDGEQIEGDRKVLSVLAFEEPAGGQIYADDLLKMYMPFQCDIEFVGGPVYMLKSSVFTVDDLDRSPWKIPFIRLLDKTPWGRAKDRIPFPPPQGMRQNLDRVCMQGCTLFTRVAGVFGTYIDWWSLCKVRKPWTELINKVVEMHQ